MKRYRIETKGGMCEAYTDRDEALERARLLYRPLRVIDIVTKEIIFRFW